MASGQGVTRDSGERSYPLMLRDQGYEVWKPLVGILLFLMGFFLVQAAFLIPLTGLVAADYDGNDLMGEVERIAKLETVTWQGMLYLNLSLASLTLVAWAVVRAVHQRRPRTLASVRPGFRWAFFWACFGLSLVALGAQIGVSELLPGDVNGLHEPLNEWTSTLAGLALVIVLTTPLQAIGEEYGFRSYLLQAFGSLTKQPWIAIVLSAVLFALAHGVQNPPLFLDRFTFGLIAAYLVYRTGGLEAGIALHIWNNLVAFGFALLLGNIDETLKVSEISWWNIPLTITQNGVYLVLVLWVAARMKVRRTTAPAAALPGPPPGSDPVLLPGTRSV